MNFISEHKKLVITLSIILVIIVAMFTIRTINLSKKNNNEQEQNSSESIMQEDTKVEEDSSNEETTKKYDSDLGIGLDKGSQHVEIPSETPEPTTKPEPVIESFDLSVYNYDKTSVPNKLIDGSSCKNYLRNVSLNDFGSNWGTGLTNNDKISKNRILVGVNQNPKDTQKGDLQSVGWLMNNLNSISDDTCIKFTDLHVVGSLSTNHVALLCMYNWYSVYGLKDTLVLFEDLSGTLKISDFSEGSVISFGVYRHNMKVVDVNGQRVVVVQYVKE